MTKKDMRIEDFGVSSELHLCDSCCLDFLTCPANILIWGDGRGDDNVVACISYEPILSLKDHMAKKGL